MGVRSRILQAALQHCSLQVRPQGTHQLHRATATDLQMWKESEHWVSANDSLAEHGSEAQDPSLEIWQESLRSTSAGHVPRVLPRPRREQPEAWHVADSGRYHRAIKLHSLRWLPSIWCDCVESEITSDERWLREWSLQPINKNKNYSCYLQRNFSTKSFHLIQNMFEHKLFKARPNNRLCPGEVVKRIQMQNSLCRYCVSETG